MMARDALIKKPELRNTYVGLFREEVLGDHARLGKLVREAFIESDNEYIPKSDELIAALDSAVEELLNSDELRYKEDACNVKKHKMKSYIDAESHIRDVWEAMRDYSKYAKHLIDTKPNKIADDLVPIIAESLDIHLGVES